MAEKPQIANRFGREPTKRRKEETNMEEQTNVTTEEATTEATTTETEKVETPDVQELLMKIAMLEKKADKTAKEAGEWRKKYQSTLSEQEQERIAKAEKEAEKEAHYAELEKEVAVSRYEKNFLKLGYSEEQAKQAGEAQFASDFETLMKIQAEVQETLLKAKEAELIKGRKEPSVGTGEDGTGMTREQFEKLDFLELVQLKAEHPEVFEQFNK